LAPILSSAQAATTRIITLQEAIDSSLVLNKDVKKALIKSEISKHLIATARQKMIPELNFHTGFSFTSPLDQFQNGTDRAPVRYDIPSQIYDFSTNASVPLFMGGKISNDIKKQKEEAVLSAQNVEKEKRDDKLEVIGYYLNVYYYLEQEKVMMQNLFEDSLRIKQVRSLKRNGAVTENEVLREELLLSDHRLMLLTISNNRDIALHQLKILLELNEQETVMIDTTALAAALLAVPDYNECLRTAMQDADELKMSRTEEAIHKLDEKIVKGNFYPTVSAKGDYGFYHPNYEFFPPTNYAYRIGSIGVSMIFNVSTLYKNWQQVSISRSQTEMQQEETKRIGDDLKNKVFGAYKKYTEAIQRIAIEEQAAIQATENYRIVKEKYLNQLALVTELIDADNTQLDFRTKAVTARIDARLKYYQLLYVTGKL
jgi:outer membrane protein TolC